MTASASHPPLSLTNLKVRKHVSGLCIIRAISLVTPGRIASYYTQEY